MLGPRSDEWTMPTPLFYQLTHKPAFNRQHLVLPRKDALSLRTGPGTRVAGGVG